MLQDLRHALRALRQAPVLTAVAIATLALGIGANTAVFSVVNAVLLTPPPFDNPDRLMLINISRDRFPGRGAFSYPNYTDLRDRAQTFEEIAAWAPWGNQAFNLTGDGEPERVSYGMGTANLFSVLRVRPAVGRTFTQAEDAFGGGPRVVMVSHGLWQRHFGSDPALVGKTILLDAVPYSVVGVLPEDFRFASGARAPDVWLPLGLDPGNQGRHYARAVSYLAVIGRLQDGATIAVAQADLSRIATQLATETPDLNGGLALSASPLWDTAVGSLRPALGMLLGAVAVVLLIACANVANLLLARATVREREIAIRVALGAGRARLIRTLLTESVVLALLGGLAGVLLATWGVSAFASLPMFGPPDELRPFQVGAGEIGLDWRVLAFTSVVSCLTGLLFGLAPALQILRGGIEPTIKASGARAGVGADRRRMRDTLVIAQIALSLVLLAGAGLLLRSLSRLTSQDTGFEPAHVFAADLSLPPATYDSPERLRVFAAQLTARVAQLPSVASAGLVDQPPLSGRSQATDFLIAGEAEPARDRDNLAYSVVTPDYFHAIGATLVAGRHVATTDDERGSRVIIINETMAAQTWPGDNALGKRLTLSTEAIRIGPRGEPSWDWQGASREVVGVVADMKHDSLSGPTVAEAYIPYAQAPVRALTLVVRTTGDPLGLTGGVRRELAAIDPSQALSRIRTMDDDVATSIGAPRFRTMLLGVFAGLALALAAVGIYGVMSYSVTQRTREIGIRAALGADRSDLAGLVVREGVRLAIPGLVIGMLCALAATRVLRGMLYGMSPTDVPTLLGVTTLLGGIAVLASWVPARRAARIDPMTALRGE